MRHRPSPRQSLRRAHMRGSETLASLDNPTAGLLDASRPLTPVRAFDREITAVLFRDGSCFVEVTDDVWPDQDHQLGFADRIVLGARGVTKDRDVSQNGDLAAANGLA